MNKEPVTKFDLAAAFKALDELEIPVAEKGIRPNKVNLEETFVRKNKTDALIEDYYDINDQDDLEQAHKDREEEIAKAKLARIEKIVDLDAKSPEDLQPTYVGKEIIQCPQCMTLFYKDPEDVEASEEDPETVNIGEVCQHCGNDSGYTLVGKVGAAEQKEPDFPSEETEDELNLNFEEPTEETEEAPVEEETPAEDEAPIEEKEPSLEPVGKEEEKKEESLNKAETAVLEHEPENKTENVTLNEKVEKLPESVNTPEKPENYTENKSENLTLNEAKGDKYIIYGTNSKGDVLHKEDYTDKTGKVDDLKKARDLVLDKDENITTVYVAVVRDGKEKPLDLYTTVKKGHEFDTAPDEELTEAKGDKYIFTATDPGAKVLATETYIDKTGKAADLKKARDIFFNKDDKFIQVFVTVIKNGKEVALNGYTAVKKGHARDGMKDDIDESIHEPEHKAEAAELEYAPENKTLNEEAIEIKVEVQPGAEVNVNVEQEEKPTKAPIEAPLPEVAPEIEVAPAVMDEPIIVDMPVEPSAAEKVDEIEHEFKAEEEPKFEVEVKPEEKPEEEEDDIKVDDLEDIDETLLNKHITESLTNVYKNVDNFATTSCSLCNGRFIIEGVITFTSGNTKNTTYTFNEGIVKDNTIVFSGINEDLDAKGEFKLKCSVVNGSLISEQLSYKYTVENILVEGYTGK